MAVCKSRMTGPVGHVANIRGATPDITKLHELKEVPQEAMDGIEIV